MEKETIETKKKEKSLLKSIGGAALAVGGLAVTILTTINKEKKRLKYVISPLTLTMSMERLLFLNHFFLIIVF